MLTGRRYLLAPTPEQALRAEEIGNICRAVWNTALEQRREYRRRGSWIDYGEQARQVAEAKADRDCSWIATAPSHVLQQTLRDLDRACRTHGTWKVRWRSKARSAPTFRFPDPKQIAVRRINRRWGEVKLPKFGSMRFRWTRHVGGKIRNATVRRDAGHWYISFCVEDGIAEIHSNGNPPVGIDLGVAVAVSTSDGVLHNGTFVKDAEEARLRRLRRQISRSVRIHGSGPSKRRDVARAEYGRLNRRIRSRRADFTAKMATHLSQNYGMVVVEALNIRNMTASAKGTIAAPGSNVRAKSGLNRSIMSKGWRGFLVRLEHAGRHHGATVIAVNPAYTSQTCHACKHVDAKSRESQARFRCTACGFEDHADVNAAKNILAAGLAVTGRGDSAVGQSAKRQPSVRAAT